MRSHIRTQLGFILILQRRTLTVRLHIYAAAMRWAHEQLSNGEKCDHLIPQLLGDSLRVDWQTMRFARQANSGVLVGTMSSLITARASLFDKRPWLINESATRFHQEMRLNIYVQVLTSTMHGGPLQYKGALQGCRV